MIFQMIANCRCFSLGIVFLLVGWIFSGVGFSQQIAENSDSAPVSTEQIRQWIAELGNDSYMVRQRAEAKLVRAGIDAFSELKLASKSEDIEVVRRVQQVLAQLELSYLAQESELVRGIVDLYAGEQNVAQKALYLWILASPIEYQEGESLRTLSRIARFDSERALRIEATKCLIASPPFSLIRQKTWYTSLRDGFAQTGGDELLQLIYQYAKIRCEIFDLKEKAEAQADEAEKNGAPFVPSVTITAGEELKNDVLQLTESIAAFQAKPESSSIQPGNRIDLLLFWALAELQDDVGLTAERERTIQAALAVRTETIRSENPLMIVDPLEGKAFSSHYVAAEFLMRRERLLWAERFFQLVIREGSLEMKNRAYEGLILSLILREKYEAAVETIDDKLRLIDTKEFKSVQGDSQELKKKGLASKYYCLARIASQENDWNKVKELIDQALQNDPYEIDSLILRHQLQKHLPNLDESYRNLTKTRIGESLGRIERKLVNNETTLTAACNQAAWILGNTDGDYRATLAMIQVATRAESDSAAYLDTEAHVHALGGEFAKAVEVQKKAVRLCPEADVFRSALKRFEAARDKAK